MEILIELATPHRMQNWNRRNRNSEMRFDSIEIQIRSTIKQTEELISQTQSFRLRGQLEHFGKLKGELTPNYPS